MLCVKVVDVDRPNPAPHISFRGLFDRDKGKYVVRLLEVKDLVTRFYTEEGVVHAVNGISYELDEGESMGIVGESGCGKSVGVMSLLRLIPQPPGRIERGEVMYGGRDILQVSDEEMRSIRGREIAMIFQDPMTSMNPRMSVGNIVGEPLQIHNIGDSSGRNDRIQELLGLVGLNPYFVNRYPHEFSGGQRQRIGIARALATNPRFIVADEPISALDVSIQAQVVNLMDDLKAELGLTYLFIAHDLSMVRYISDRVAVMYLGRIVELSERDEVFDHPLHPYTQALLSAIPIPDPEKEDKRQRLILEGDVPSPADPPIGCRFHPRCSYATEICENEDLEFRDLGANGAGHWVACHHAERFL
jgi:oligopeptide transport system ATP-binding protein